MPEKKTVFRNFMGLSMLLAASLSATSAKRENRTKQILTEPVRPVKKPVPKGCREYFFDKAGNYSNKDLNRDHWVFRCVARTDEAASRKFNNWKNSLP